MTSYLYQGLVELFVLVLPIQTVPSATPAVLPVGKGVMHAVVIGRRVQTTEHSWRPWLLNWYGITSLVIYMYIQNLFGVDNAAGSL